MLLLFHPFSGNSLAVSLHHTPSSADQTTGINSTVSQHCTSQLSQFSSSFLLDLSDLRYRLNNTYSSKESYGSSNARKEALNFLQSDLAIINDFFSSIQVMKPQSEKSKMSSSTVSPAIDINHTNIKPPVDTTSLRLSSSLSRLAKVTFRPLAFVSAAYRSSASATSSNGNVNSGSYDGISISSINGAKELPHSISTSEDTSLKGNLNDIPFDHIDPSRREHANAIAADVYEHTSIIIICSRDLLLIPWENIIADFRVSRQPLLLSLLNSNSSNFARHQSHTAVDEILFSQTENKSFSYEKVPPPRVSRDVHLPSIRLTVVNPCFKCVIRIFRLLSAQLCQ